MLNKESVLIDRLKMSPNFVHEVSDIIPYTEKMSSKIHKLEYDVNTNLEVEAASDTEMEILRKNDFSVKHCPWYFPSINSKDASKLIRNSSVGTFLLRNSSEPTYLYSLTVQTQRGPTSVRIHYSRGLFQLDCEEKVKELLPKFDNVIALINFHATLSKDDKENHCRWLEKSGRKKVPVKLVKPRIHKPATLKHLSRIVINNSQSDIHIPKISTDLLPLPQSLKLYLRDYTYRL